MTKKKAKKKVNVPTRRILLYVDETMFVEGHGYRPVFVVEGEDGYRENGTWPYEGKVGQTVPWFFGPTIEDARRACAQRNELLGLTAPEAAMLVAQSMLASKRRRGARHERT